MVKSETLNNFANDKQKLRNCFLFLFVFCSLKHLQHAQLFLAADFSIEISDLRKSFFRVCDEGKERVAH